MKRAIALVLCLMMLCVCALAEEATRVNFGETFSLLRPDSLDVVEIGEDEASESMVYAATNDQLEMYVWAYDMEGKTVDALYDEWREDDFLQNVTLSTVGSLSYLTYEIEGEGLGAVFACDDGKYYDFVFYCWDDAAMEVARSILDSVEIL